MTVHPDDLRELACLEAQAGVLSVHLRTDPRDPGGTGHVPPWVTALRNGSREVLREAERDGSREGRLALRDLLPRVEAELLGLDAAERARGVSWFVAPDGTLDRRFALQLAPRDDVVVWDARPFVAPLVDVADRGRRAGFVLVGVQRLRLVVWEGGRAQEAEAADHVLELGEDWREQRGPASANPGRGQQTATHVEHHERRVGAWRRRFLVDGLQALDGRVAELGCERVVLAADRGVLAEAEEALPPGLRERVVAVVDVNLVDEEPAVVADRLEGHLEAAWRDGVRRLAELAAARAEAGGRGVTGLADTSAALAAHRVERLVLDPTHPFDPAELPPQARHALADPPRELLAERLVELAVRSSADLTSVPTGDLPALARVGGVAATLRW